MNFTNPIIKGFNPDPSICRVGKDYYLITSSFEYFPGIPVYHSRDLVNWEMVGHAISRDEQLPIDKAKSSGGIWAPTIRYYDGTFYIAATFDGMGNFIINSENPSEGWSNPVWVENDGIDPTILFEDGKMYYCATDLGKRQEKYDSEGVSLAEFDIKTGKFVSEPKRIWIGAGGGWMEAPHIYHIGEYYYAIAAEGGTGQGHHEIAGRSKSIWGPYENCPENPILTNRNDTTKQIACTGHGDMIDDINGNWWMVHLGTRPVAGMTHIGRETFLMPIIWKDGWPIVGERKKALINVDAPLWNEQKKIEKWSADFSQDKMEKQWLFRRIPEKENYIRENGILTLKPTTIKLNDSFGSPTFMAIRPIDLKYIAETEFEFEAVNDGDSAGITVYLSENFYYRIYKKREKNEDYIIFERQIDDMNIIAYHEKTISNIIKMKIETDGEKYYFYYSIGNEYIIAGSGSVKYLSTNIAEKCFTGNLVGIFTESDVATTAHMKVYSYKMEAL